MRHRTFRLARVSSEFALIVTGVLCALAVDNWAEGREERAIEAEYMESLQADLHYNEQHLLDLREDLASIGGNIEFALTVVRDPEASDNRSAQLAAIFRASRGRFPALLDNAYRDLQATGNLRLISDPALRQSIVAYHREVERWAVENYQLVRANRLPYRNSVRGRLPLALQDAIEDGCPMRGVPPACQLDFDPAVLDAALRKVLADQDLEKSLTLWASSMRSSVQNVDLLLQETRDLLSQFSSVGG